jgi:hypothetical protein
LAGIDHRDGQLRRRQRRHHGPLVAPCGFEDNQGGLSGLESLHQGRNPGGVVDYSPTLTGGPQGNIELGFRYINTSKKRWSRHKHS